MPISDETRNLIYNKLKESLEKLSPPMVVKTDATPNAYEIIGNKPVPYGYDKKIAPGMFFAWIAHRKDSVAFYFFPVYMNAKLIELAPGLQKFMKGKTCFHFKKVEQVNVKELDALLNAGLDAWKQAGYMK
jgi:hypothetical protein